MDETNGRKTLREAHAEYCREAGMAEEAIARDWAEFQTDYDAWLDDRRAQEDADDPRFADADCDEESEDLEEVLTGSGWDHDDYRNIITGSFDDETPFGHELEGE